MILQGDCLARLREIPDESAHCCVTSPPYLRDYGFDGQIGLEETPEASLGREMKPDLRTLVACANCGLGYPVSDMCQVGDDLLCVKCHRELVMRDIGAER